MKKLIASIFAVCAIAFTANAQFYFSGSLGLNVNGTKDASSANFHIDPGIGYQMSDATAVGIFLSLGGGSGFEWSLNPYFRYTFADVSDFHFFADARVSLGQISKTFCWGVGILPGFAYSISNSVDIVTHVACLGVKGYGQTTVFRFNLLDGASVGMQFKF
ncbi:MAG: hypothetical protein MJY48_05935 [Bacteroidales bacterium]|nr:hypothetical protein [Bacteroidales bacterium]